MTAYRSHQVCSMVGISYRQIDYWDRIGLLVPSVSEARGSGTQRRYSDSDVRRALIVKQLMMGQGSTWPERLRQVVARLPADIPASSSWLVVGAGGSCLTTDDRLAVACARYGPGCMVVSLVPLVPAAVAS